MDEAPLRVLLVLNSLGAGGTERSTALLLPGLREAGIDPVVACFVRRDEGDQQAVVDAGFDVRFVPGGWAGRVAGVRRLIDELQPAVVHTAIFEADVAGRVAAAGSGVPVLSSLVNTPYDPARYADPRVTPWKLRTVQLVDSLTGRSLVSSFHAVTEGVAADAIDTLGFRRERIRVVERGRDLDELGHPSAARRAAVRASLGLDPDQPVVLAVGRVEYQKAHDVLVEAVARLGGDPAPVLLVAGRDGNAGAELAAAIDRTGIGDRVRLLGHRTDVPDLLAAADVFAMPSLYEGTAGAAIEALALGCPVVASDLAGTAGLLVDGVNARLVPPGAIGDLTDALATALGDTDGRNGALVAHGRREVGERFGLERAVRDMADLYRATAAEGPTIPRLARRAGRVAGANGTDAGTGTGAASPKIAPRRPPRRASRHLTRASVVIPVRNGAGTIGAQLDALATQAYDGDWEVVVADNGSTDGTADLVAGWSDRLPRLQVVDASDVAGSSHARNVGADAASGEALAFCDADDVVADGWLAGLVSALAQHDLVGGPQEVEKLNDGAVRSWRSTRPATSLNVASRFLPFAPTSNLGVWADVYHQIGGLSDDYIQSHDVEFSWRAQLAGYGLGFAPDAVVHYRFRDTMRGIAKQAYVSGLDAAQLYHDFGHQGMPRDSWLAMARGWLWLLVRLPMAIDPARRGTYVRRLGTQAGKAVGSIRWKVVYL